MPLQAFSHTARLDSGTSAIRQPGYAGEGLRRRGAIRSRARRAGWKLNRSPPREGSERPNRRARGGWRIASKGPVTPHTLAPWARDRMAVVSRVRRCPGPIIPRLAAPAPAGEGPGDAAVTRWKAWRLTSWPGWAHRASGTVSLSPEGVRGSRVYRSRRTACVGERGRGETVAQEQTGPPAVCKGEPFVIETPLFSRRSC